MNEIDTIAALSTPPLVSALGVIRMSGDQAIEVAQAMFSKTIERSSRPLVLHGRIVDGEKPVDDVVLTAYFAPASFTGEDTVEISCHGSPVIENRILELAIENGARLAKRGEFTRRAFKNGKLDLIEAESVIDLIEAESPREAEAALGTLHGSLSRTVGKVREELLSLSARLLAFVDYPDDEIEDVTPHELLDAIRRSYTTLCTLRDGYKGGKLLKDGVRTVIVGCPNAGKSTLMNRLCSAEKSIVTPIAGTTRDVVETTAVFGGMKLRLCDTAGLRDSGDEIEKIGIARARETLADADLVLYVHSLVDMDEVPPEIFKCTAKKVLVFNKFDLWQKPNLDDGTIGRFDGVVFVSAKNDMGFDSFETVLKTVLGKVSVTDGVVMNARQYECLVRAADALRNALDHGTMTPDVWLSDCEAALGALGEMTGERVSAEIVDTIFARFCVGK